MPSLFVNTHRNASAVVLHGNNIAGQNFNLDMGAKTRQRFIDRVIHNFINKMVQPRGPVEPIYMPGLLRTASSPSST